MPVDQRRKDEMMSQQTPFEPTLTVFMLVKTTAEWLGFTVDRRFKLLDEHVAPILRKHAESVSLRFFDVEFYSARVTDIWMWDAKDHHAYQLLVENLRETPFWDRYFEVVEILTGVENAYAKNNDRAPISA
ncbi:darcynin family protein [Sphingomonas echinoides]|uniref:Darcynin family protein n=2 Tax=Sphingomonas echinoides TaxID=59803 RepID=A0ABU4PPN7_9SPHN|nr:darcynin family protein [Sphingomonas echinoides]MDX5984764.1 darcynin family protein [Sphingomonas echinoides]